MKNKGFTLIELLAVIIVLAVIALIAIPIITNVIEKSKKGALKDSAYGILDAAEMYLSKNMSEEINDSIEFTCSNGECINGEEKITYKGQIEAGKIKIYTDSEIELCITKDNYSVLKKVTDKEPTVTKGSCKYEELSYSVDKLVSLEELNKKQDELDKINERIDNIKGKLSTTLTDNNIEPVDENGDGVISLDEIIDTSVSGISDKAELVYLGTTFPGTLTYTAARSCDAKIAISSSNWYGPTLTVVVRQNGAEILRYTSMGTASVDAKINKGDVITYLNIAGTPNRSHMSMAIFCLN